MSIIVQIQIQVNIEIYKNIFHVMVEMCTFIGPYVKKYTVLMFFK